MRLSNKTTQSCKTDCPNRKRCFFSLLHHSHPYLHTATVFVDTVDQSWSREAFFPPLWLLRIKHNFTTEVQIIRPSSSITVNTKQRFAFVNGLRLIMKSMCSTWVFPYGFVFVFAYCQSLDSHKKETKCLPTNNPSKTHHLRHLSHSRLCV